MYSAPPVYRKDKDYPVIWRKLFNLTTAMCWKLIARQVQTAIWVKEDDDSCLSENAKKNLLSICEPVENTVPQWQSPLRDCITLSNDQHNFQKLPLRPDRLAVYSRILEKLGIKIFTC